MWDEYGLGVQNQSPKFTITYRLGVAQISDKIPKAKSAWATIVWWEHVHMHIHSIQGDVTDILNLFYLSAYASDGAWGAQYVTSVKLGTCVLWNKCCFAKKRNFGFLGVIYFFSILMPFFHCFVMNVHMSQK